jgi:hypothetical protein
MRRRAAPSMSEPTRRRTPFGNLISIRSLPSAAAGSGTDGAPAASFASRSTVTGWSRRSHRPALGGAKYRSGTCSHRGAWPPPSPSPKVSLRICCFCASLKRRRRSERTTTLTLTQGASCRLFSAAQRDGRRSNSLSSHRNQCQTANECSGRDLRSARGFEMYQGLRGRFFRRTPGPSPFSSRKMSPSASSARCSFSKVSP